MNPNILDYYRRLIADNIYDVRAYSAETFRFARPIHSPGVVYLLGWEKGGQG